MPSQSTPQKKKRGPKPTGQGAPVVVRIHEDLLSQLDQWIAEIGEAKLTRPEAIRSILRERLAGPTYAEVRPKD